MQGLPLHRLFMSACLLVAATSALAAVHSQEDAGAGAQAAAAAAHLAQAAAHAAQAAAIVATTDELDPEVFAQRRAALLAKLGADATVVLFSAPERERNNDVDFPYRQGSDFWYLTGFPEPRSAAILETRDGTPHCTLFVPEANPASELWTGRRLGLEGAGPLADEVLGARGLNKGLRERLAGKARVLACFSGDERSRDLLKKVVDEGVTISEQELRHAVGYLRLVKEPEEIALLARSIQNTCEAHKNAMRFAEPGRFEYQIQAVIEYTYMMLGSPRLGFPSIVGSGRNSVILHYETNRDPVPPDKTIVIDIGAEYGYYSADVTRTLPSSGRFTPEAAVIYQAVLDAQKAGIAAAKPGATIGAIDHAARTVLGAALVKAGVVESPGAGQALCPHGICHWLGLDVHDDCPYESESGKGEVVLAPGMVTTVEPGCYIRAGTEGVDAKWWDLGVRIEDDVLITEEGNIVLSAGAPREITEIEALMAEKNPFPRFE